MAKSKKNGKNHIYVPADPPRGPSLLPILILLFIWPFGTFVSFYLAFKRGKAELTRRRYQNYRRYAGAIGDRGSVSIRELTKRAGRSTAEVISDLQAMIDQGFISGSAYIDRTSMMLYMDSDVVETEFTSPTINVYVTPDVKTEAEARAETRVDVQADEARAPKVGRPETIHTPGADTADFESKLSEIRRLNEEIEDGPVSDRIDRIGELTASIFRVVREKPERTEEVRKFMNYYLPTTFKLLKSYSLMEKQSYQGENIQASRKKIEDVLDTLIHAFEQQQDRLFQSEALDVETDISVLETMMASDGLLGERGSLRMRASDGSEF